MNRGHSSPTSRAVIDHLRASIRGYDAEYLLQIPTGRIPGGGSKVTAGVTPP
ncbi:hypothetical protein FOXB_17212 [Fusarium oxysporum f. sp. conglutinans Fo5176]|uniref:Uncharacterized protein n=1 Tax=Fusarium oxysporum (strain Fo5176) TaxID=660025 RepID=F9GEX8_FUSOF|nr:hypothetical protein FOXB_17212 [Fusarium oxysporum f. sp. conglutinans Fo5176]